MCDDIPPFLTVAEAGRLLRIGRTKAYDLTQEWRDTDGRSGLPVVDLGDLLRVPGPAIEEMLHKGSPKSATSGRRNGTTSRRRAAETSDNGEFACAPESPICDTSPAASGGEARDRPAPRRTRRRNPIADDQLPLFEPPPSPSPDSQEPSAS
jgi:hypothetical protein